MKCVQKEGFWLLGCLLKWSFCGLMSKRCCNKRTLFKLLLFWRYPQTAQAWLVFFGEANASKQIIFSNSHGDDILNIKVLQRGHIRVFTSVCLQNQLLNDPVQQQPVVHHSTALFICTGTHACISYSVKAMCRRVEDQ